MRTETQRKKALCEAMGIFMGMLEDTPVREVAKKAKLSTTTIYRYRKRPATLNIKLNTVESFAAACGCVVQLKGKGVELGLN